MFVIDAKTVALQVVLSSRLFLNQLESSSLRNSEIWNFDIYRALLFIFRIMYVSFLRYDVLYFWNLKIMMKCKRKFIHSYLHRFHS